jgi:hypothetical protein
MWYSGVYKALIIGSVVSFLISFFSTGKMSYNSLISGYSTLTLGIMLILTILISKILEITKNDTTSQMLITILISLGPFLLMLTVIGFILYLIIFYKTPILDNHVSQSYYTFSNITIILLLIQIYIVYKNITTKEFDVSGKISKVTSSLIYLIGVLSSLSAMIIYIVLKYFRTDGFKVLNN